MHAVKFTKEAAKALERMPRNLRETILARLTDPARDPLAASNVKKLVGQPG